MRTKLRNKKNQERPPFSFLAIWCGVSLSALGAQTQTELLDLFPESTVFTTNQSETEVSFDYSPSTGPWLNGLEERDVFQLAMTHKQDQENSYQLRVGKGGQIYSLEGAFGESLPPSWRRNSSASSPWNDEVWQFVAVCGRYNLMRKKYDWLEKAKPYRAGYFIHNSGCYMPENELGLKNLYCPLLASDYNAQTKTYRQLNWGLVPQHQTINRSPILYYLQVRDAGDGIIELTWAVHNFSTRSDIVFDHLNAPWGGTRLSSLPNFFLSTPNGALTPREEIGTKGGINVRKTGGFTLSCADESLTSPSIALVYGRDKNLERELALAKIGKEHCQLKPSLFRSWLAGGPGALKHAKRLKPNEHRNYNVQVVIPKFNLKPQTTIWYRSYLVISDKDQSLKLAPMLVDHVDYGLLEFDEKTTPRIVTRNADGNPVFSLYAHPVTGTLPVFKLRDKKTGKIAYTTDPYLFTPQKELHLDIPPGHKNYDYYKNAIGYTLNGQTEYRGLLGYGYRNNPNKSGWSTLSKLVPRNMLGAESEYNIDVWAQDPEEACQ